MNTNGLPASANKKEYITEIGSILVKKYGRKRFYSPEEVKKAHAKTNWSDSLDLPIWGMSAFSSQLEFDRYFRRMGLAMDYTKMKTEALQSFSVTEGSHILEQSVRKKKRKNKISWPDFGEVFGQLLFGFLEFIGGLF